MGAMRHNRGLMVYMAVSAIFMHDIIFIIGDSLTYQAFKARYSSGCYELKSGLHFC